MMMEEISNVLRQYTDVGVTRPTAQEQFRTTCEWSATGHDRSCSG